MFESVDILSIYTLTFGTTKQVQKEKGSNIVNINRNMDISIFHSTLKIVLPEEKKNVLFSVTVLFCSTKVCSSRMRHERWIVLQTNF